MMENQMEKKIILYWEYLILGGLGELRKDLGLGLRAKEFR